MRPVFSLVVAVSSFGCASPDDAKNDVKQGNYYPLAKGNKWEYQVSVRGKETHLTSEITEIETNAGKTLARCELREPNTPAVGEDVSADAKGVYRNGVLGAKLAAPLTVLKYPVKVGDSWSEKADIGNGPVEITSTVKDAAAAIEVPAGKFKAVLIDGVMLDRDGKMTAKHWYVSGIGLVKQTISRGSEMLTMELKKFTPGK